jgi:thiol-disulfide isomerase/thioredoxin
MKNSLFLYSLLILTVIFMVGCATGIPQLPINNNLQGNESDQGNNQDESTGVPRVVFIELFNTVGCPASKAINPIIEEIVAEYENTEVILVEMAGWGDYATEETYERFKWYFSDKSKLHTPSICFDGLNQLFAEGFSLGGGGNSGNSGNEDVGDAGDNEDPGTVEVDTTKPVITGSRAPLPNSFGWNNIDVTVSFNCADTGAVKSAININTVAGKTVTTEGKDQSVTNTGVCTDAAGNTADSVTVSNINIDKTPPVVTITLPGTGEYVLNQSITATWSATDALSGAEDSKVPKTINIDTKSVGKKKITLPAGTAKDKAGNSSQEVTTSYSVIADVEEPGTENPQKWSGLTGFVAWYGYVEWTADTWLANGFTEWRDLRDYLDTTNVNASKAAVIAGNAKGLKAIWGVTSSPTVITAANWPIFRQAILDAAQWAQNNGVYEFQIGNEEELHVDGTTMTVSQIIANLKSVATDVKAIFTRGNVSYSMSWDNEIWRQTGKGDLDIIGLNFYRGSEVGTFDDWWKEQISSNHNAFGDDMYISEFGLSSINIENYSTDEAVQAAGVIEMIDYIKSLGINRALFYTWHDYPGGLFGAVKDDETYRLLWSQALLNSESVKFATVPTKTTTASLPGAIALIPRITR